MTWIDQTAPDIGIYHPNDQPKGASIYQKYIVLLLEEFHLWR